MLEEFEGPHGYDTLEKCFLLVNYALKRFLVNTPWRCSWKLTLGKGLVSGESADKCRCCAKVFSCRKSLKVHVVTIYWRKAFCMWTMWWNVFYWKQLEDAHEISRWVKALFLEKVLTNIDAVQKFFHVGRVWRSMWPLLTEERPSAYELFAKTFSSGHNLKMHMKVHAEWRPSQCRHWINCGCFHRILVSPRIHLKHLPRRFLFVYFSSFGVGKRVHH